jgi:aryl-alcohol dehydrogenase-like predicted oxidoreductase
LYSQTEEADRRVVDRLGEISDKRGVSRAQIALAWMLGKRAVTSPIVGATKLQHLKDATASVSLRLTAEEIKSLEESYIPHPIVGFS